MFRKCCRIAQNHEFHSCPRDSDIHSSKVIQKSDLSILIRPYETDKNNIPFLPLKAVNGVDRDEAAEWAQKTIPFDFPP